MAHAHPIQFHHGPHTTPLTPNPNPNAPQIGKVNRGFGNPVALPKNNPRFEQPPAIAGPTNLNLPMNVVLPTEAAAAESGKKLVFHMVGDTGGVHGEATETAIAHAMTAQCGVTGAARPAFFFSLGDVVYFNGQSNLYQAQFYEPYQDYPRLIFAIAGNHDGDTQVHKGDPADTEPSLFGFMRNFCDTTATHVTPYRDTMTQPYVYWTLDTPLITIIGLYSNVDGSLDARGRNEQQTWFQQQMTSAPKDKWLAVAVHHPPYSLDSTHGGTLDILTAIDRATVAANRGPDIVFSGHVHNYQRFSRNVGKRNIPYIVAGAGGYANDSRSMHKLQKGAMPLPFQTTHPDVKLMNFNHQEPGFLRVTVAPDAIDVEYFLVPFDDSAVTSFDSVQVK
jgi:predicted phosphodiesterase